MTKPAKDEAELVERIADVLRACVDEDKCGYAGQAIESLAAIRAAGWAVVPARLTKDMEYDALRAENARLREALKNLLDRDERNTCQHEETHRGGFLWEICDVCGAKWADDMGGKTEWKDPPEWVGARAALEVKP
jgi:hypothetical protein